MSLFKKYISLIMLLQLSHFFSLLYSPPPCMPLTPAFPPCSSCPWVIHISSLASPFPILFLTSPCLFCTYHLCYLFSVPFPPFSPLPLPTALAISSALALYCESALLASSTLYQVVSWEEVIWLYAYRAVSLIFSCLLACLFTFFPTQSTLSFHDVSASELLINDAKWVKSDRPLFSGIYSPVEVR